MSGNRYLIMAGGTGGHIFPALAVAKELMQRGAKVSWLGTAQGLEAEIIATENIEFHAMTIKGFRGKSIASKLLAPFLLCRAIIQAARVIRRYKPSVVIGFGGFVAAPGGIAARLLCKPLVIHEQNSIAGSSNRLLAKIATKKLVAFPDALNDAVHVGNPVRAAVSHVNHDFLSDTKEGLRVLIMGGSLGAKAINDVVPFALAAMGTNTPPAIWHQTGKGKKVPVSAAYQEQQVEARVEEFIDDVAAAYMWADVIICRAGALTVSEVAAAGVPAIFVPLPSAIDNHQLFNAKWLVDHQAALVIEQKDLTKKSLCQMLEMLHENREKLMKMHKTLKQLAKPSKPSVKFTALLEPTITK
jgi:UDP-N-acetylglucosamine--N-acetylmuramyl-(pentapeptide) pyrophosphoryl-undecaprenol N-acetylglucosamine transferase